MSLLNFQPSYIPKDFSGKSRTKHIVFQINIYDLVVKKKISSHRKHLRNEGREKQGKMKVFQCSRWVVKRMVTDCSRNTRNKILLRRRASVIASIPLPQLWHPSPYVVHLGQGVHNVATKSVLLS